MSKIIPIFVPTKRNDMELTKNIICGILEKYKGVHVPQGGIELSKGGDYLMLKAQGMTGRNMPLAAKRILARFPEIRMVHFTGGWTEHVYSRNTLKWMAI